MDRRAGRRPARARPRLRRGVRRRGAGPPGGLGRRRRRQSRGLRPRPAALPPSQSAVRARDGGDLRGAWELRRRQLPADDRARPGSGRRPRAHPRAARARRQRLRVDAEPPDARAARRPQVGQPLARQGVPRRGVPRALRGCVRPGDAAGGLPRPKARRPRVGARSRLGSRAPPDAPVTAVLRRATSRCARPNSIARSTSSPSVAETEPRARAARRPAGRVNPSSGTCGAGRASGSTSPARRRRPRCPGHCA